MKEVQALKTDVEAMYGVDLEPIFEYYYFCTHKSIPPPSPPPIYDSKEDYQKRLEEVQN